MNTKSKQIELTEHADQQWNKVFWIKMKTWRNGEKKRVDKLGNLFVGKTDVLENVLMNS